MSEWADVLAGVAMAAFTVGFCAGASVVGVILAFSKKETD